MREGKVTPSPSAKVRRTPSLGERTTKPRKARGVRSPGRLGKDHAPKGTYMIRMPTTGTPAGLYDRRESAWEDTLDNGGGADHSRTILYADPSLMSTRWDLVSSVVGHGKSRPQTSIPGVDANSSNGAAWLRVSGSEEGRGGGTTRLLGDAPNIESDGYTELEAFWREREEALREIAGRREAQARRLGLERGRLAAGLALEEELHARRHQRGEAGDDARLRAQRPAPQRTTVDELVESLRVKDDRPPWQPERRADSPTRSARSASPAKRGAAAEASPERQSRSLSPSKGAGRPLSPSKKGAAAGGHGEEGSEGERVRAKLALTQRMVEELAEVTLPLQLPSPPA